ncbi:MAG: hypothetical protein FD167_1178 [bacterium]|nr:MAG: hypothetical protein FD167_1178 [bacterium]
MTKIDNNEKTFSPTNLATLILVGVPMLFSATASTPLPSASYNIPYLNNSTYSSLGNFVIDNGTYKSIESPQEIQQALILHNFAAKLIENMKDLEPEFAQAINEDFWEMYEPI